jgi:hypothetical protein
VAAELAVTIGLIEISIGTEDVWPEEVKGNFQQKVDDLNEHLLGQVLEFMQFGSALDDADDS